MLAPEVRHRVEFLTFPQHIERCRLGLPLRNGPMFDADILARMRVGPARDIACRIDAGGTCFEKFIHENAAVDCEAGLLRQRQTRLHTDTRNHKFRFNHLAALEDGALAVDGGDGILEMKLNPVLFVQASNEITHLGPKDPLDWPLLRCYDVNL